ncbi:MAG: hypothetical protein LBE21_05615 [Pseudomonadales bacterium]|jgi:hypothetical protein|nr:hypothetical protein [Pseudomonadales bacterium]
MRHTLPAITGLLLCSLSMASDTPISGTFSNINIEPSEERLSLPHNSFKSTVNLVVTVNESGQQFFIQCFDGQQLGFGVVTIFENPRVNAVIKASPECPATEIQVELDYDSANIRTSEGWAELPRGGIYVPIVD